MKVFDRNKTLPTYFTILLADADSESHVTSGNGEAFGSVGHLAGQVEIIEGNIRPTTFINRYVMKGHPVLLQGRTTTHAINICRQVCSALCVAYVTHQAVGLLGYQSFPLSCQSF